MYLTEQEYYVLKGLKNNIPYKEIKEGVKKNFGIQMGMNDPIIEALYQKYGIKNGGGVELCQKADLCKVDIISEDEIPYYQYDSDKPYYRKQLVKKIVLTKREIKRLFKYINKKTNAKDDDKFAITLQENGLGWSAFVRDSNGETYMLGANIDGDICSDKELDEW